MRRRRVENEGKGWKKSNGKVRKKKSQKESGRGIR